MPPYHFIFYSLIGIKLTILMRVSLLIRNTKHFRGAGLLLLGVYGGGAFMLFGGFRILPLTLLQIGSLLEQLFLLLILELALDHVLLEHVAAVIWRAAKITLKRPTEAEMLI